VGDLFVGHSLDGYIVTENRMGLHLQDISNYCECCCIKVANLGILLFNRALVKWVIPFLSSNLVI
jgi:hypothetical protein